MKKRLAALLLAFALLLTLLCACDQTESPSGPTQKEQVTTEGHTQQPEAPVKKEVTVSELYSEDGKVTDSLGMGYSYSYHVPQIDDDTPDAASINEEIAALYGELAEEGLQSVKNKEIPGCNIVSYESCRSGDVLALVMKCAFYYGYYEEYSVYNYDTANGVRLTNDDILAMQGVTQEQYLDAVRRAAAKCYDDQYFPVWKDSGFDSSPGAYQELRAWTISAKNITPELPLYLDDGGAMHTIAAIGSHAGASWLYQPLTLDLEDNAADVETETSLDFLTVTRRGREVTLRWNETPRGEAVLEAYGYMDDVPYGRELPVNGLYGDYVQMYCGTIGPLEEPYVFLLTQEGRVEYIAVMAGLRGGYFCASGPLLGVDGVKSFSSDYDENGFPVVYAVAGSGERTDLGQLAEVDQYTMPSALLGSWNGTRTDGDGYEEFLSLELMDGGNGNNVRLTSWLPGEDAAMETDGHYIYRGMTEQGMVYTYRLWWVYSNGPGLEGTVALDMWWDGSEDPTLYVTELGGTPLFVPETGGMTALVRSYG